MKAVRTHPPKPWQIGERMQGPKSLKDPVRLLRILTLALVAAAYTTMVFGAYVKAIGAGLACPEWPVCANGQLVGPLSDPAVAAEMVHRSAALLVVITGLLLLALLFARFRGERRLIGLTVAAALTLGAQIGLGALTITSFLQPFVVTSHLAVATLFFGITILVGLEARQVKSVTAPAKAPAESNGASSDSEPPASFG